MPKVDCFQIAGLTLWFWSNDHDPPHFHAKKDGEWEIKVKFMLAEEEMIELKWGDMPGSKVLKGIRKQAVDHRAELLGEWEEKVNHDN